MPDLKSSAEDPRFIAGVDLLRRTGMKEFQIRYDDEQEPVVWIALASYTIHNGRPSKSGKINHHQPGSGMTPLAAVLDLCDKAMTGGSCTHCGRPTMFDENFGAALLDAYFCWYQWDPELETFRRGCEGDEK